MPITNQEVAARLREIYQLMQLAGENRFRAIAFDRAAQAVESLSDPVTVYIETETLTDVKGIGSSIAEDIRSYAHTGKIAVLEDLRSRIPDGIIKWLEISGLGPKGIAKIHSELGISELEELREACRDGRVARLSGMGEKTAEKILTSIRWLEEHDKRCRLDEALAIAGPLKEYLSRREGVEKIEVAGSLRRMNDTIGDIDLVIGAENQYIEPLFDAFGSHDLAMEVLARGETKSSIRTHNGRQADLRIVAPDIFPAALLYFTGSKEHNVALRQRARARGMALNEYGLFRLDGKGETDFDRPETFGSEEDLYRWLDLPWIAPELRENRGEIEWFEAHGEADLVEEDDIRGILHAHSTWSDGKFSIREMAKACIERGYEYLGITDHSQTAAYAGGLSPDDVRRQWEEIDRLNREYEEGDIPFRVFRGIESDILTDGSLDYDDELLEGFDFVIASVHSGLDLPREKMMDRFRRAIDHPATAIIGHPTGRLLLRRDGSDLDMNELIERAAEQGTAIEINANPRRLDLDWRYGNKARETGLFSSINPDAHSVGGIDNVWYGVQVARKARFGKDRILNSRSADDLARWFSERK